ncbi:hypothetical protein K437DRAFT_254621 [Tilletiaria anomala UBC 951]|uniref:Uncharacterized protein n=1 Tax=Tilletiaria anomala (strain ATCC 24038 / CBS 436.72 / UBC 951) TaxID=1037660 RepID=A0A066WDN6_TILAU|nr:uncharacterized protein K437DRAFT_254621 [Tilletiaria anomala UBC 951]KDN52067.1 hypothetical protein K437DRAFT_254621 [Tilletiaria anomala UBC 951]
MAATGRAVTRQASARTRAVLARSYASAPATTATAAVIGTPAVRRPVGGFRGGLAGFALGFGAAGTYGYYYLLQEYHAASNLMLTTVEELQSSTQKISSQLARVKKLEADLQALSRSTSTKEDASKSKGELLKVYNGLHEELFSVKNRLWGVEKDVNTALKGVQAGCVVGERRV